MDVRWPFFYIVSCYLLHITAPLKQQGGCYFPERWEGTWFQSGVRTPITIEGMRLSSKGRCLGSEGDKFLVVDEKRCYRCVVIHEKHTNVLQYKETFCQGREALPTLCTLITGDALLYSMFRVNALPEPCPFRGAFTFTYNRGHGECRSPVSSIDMCTEDSRLLLSYQACPDVYGSESTVEELQCLAVWKEGSSRYLVGKVQHHHATSNEDRFRCFVYEKASAASEALDGIEYRVAQSGDATCNGLFSASEGSRTMTLKKAGSLSKCRFPGWVTNSHGMGNSHWHTLDYSTTYSFHHRNATLRVTNSTSLGGGEMKIVCAQLKFSTRDETSVMLLTHFTMGCQSGFTCMAFYRRDGHVMEVQSGAHTKRMEDACSQLHFNPATTPYVTLVTTNPEARQCPYMGKFTVNDMLRRDDFPSRVITDRDSEDRSVRSINSNEQNGSTKWHRYRRTRNSHNQEIKSRRYESWVQTNAEEHQHLRYHHGFSAERHQQMIPPSYLRRSKRVEPVDNQSGGAECDSSGGFSNLVIGCSSPDTMEFRAECLPPDLISSYSCHGRWEENGTNYLITTPVSRSSHGARRYCFIYREFPPDTVVFSTATENCDRTIKPGTTGHLIFNITTVGKCIERNSAQSTSTTKSTFIFILAVLLNLHVLLGIHQR